MDSDGSPVSPRMTKRLACFMNGDAATDGVWVSKG